ncbi:MAG TPA: hypothetical protein VNL77_23530 [Roseiflexaceae bacterium]|nr:hypothetical protein [Roseiflexaceae bacterium]
MLVIDLSSSIVTWTILIALGYIGWRLGFRYILSIALPVTIGYVLTVRGGNSIVDLVNRVVMNLPRLAAFITGRSTADVEPLPALIPNNFEAPLLLRFLVFVALLAIGIGYVFPWEARLKPEVRPFHSLRVLGALTGLYTGLLLVSAAAIFWREAAGLVNLPDLLEIALSGLPTFEAVVPAVIAAFGVLLFMITLIRLPRIWWFDKEREKEFFILVPSKK